MARDVPRLQAGRVARDPGARLDQAALARVADRLVEDAVDAPFSRNRASAFWSVVKCGSSFSPKAAHATARERLVRMGLLKKGAASA